MAQKCFEHCVLGLSYRKLKPTRFMQEHEEGAKVPTDGQGTLSVQRRGNYRSQSSQQRASEAGRQVCDSARDQGRRGEGRQVRTCRRRRSARKARCQTRWAGPPPRWVRCPPVHPQSLGITRKLESAHAQKQKFGLRADGSPGRSRGPRRHLGSGQDRTP